MYYTYFSSQLGNLMLTANCSALIGLTFQNDCNFKTITNHQYKETNILTQTKKWLDIYFNKKEPKFSVEICLMGSDFQKEVWEILCKIPFGATISYGEIAQAIAKRRNIKRMSAQAVGKAVGSNKIAIIVPCHRVIGSNGSLIGYAGGLEKKSTLLKLEGVL
ncbi:MULTISPECIES: methylated-DNA--[protein]-cysteine S-methyltransferase [Helicobacter]|uniref:Methylated-DNA--[protein]-cysteine S-methyltransferase n=1 Tax=Helicobacter ibis TaxID=2962633 RepID=A0ABT4VD57_9HELI|nr:MULTISPECIES: methylated-DNA--[protein]-cysteine S-methyltransferase [Helicobacter]MDA3967291.1 methylated-DNA--[protein]-cysteine S-methyltransferase [Helicobacter sp. WB40]MDA3968641.1 methylated-DNA--[protein]-cysteine S-methyltransferase [Helicobacter ibis]